MSNFYNPAETRKAAKPHRCSYCSEFIERGESYYYQKGYWEGAWFESHMHPECMDALTDSGDSEYTPYSNERPQKGST